MKPNVLNSLHMEYGDRFTAEFGQLLEQQTFAEVVFRNSELLFEDEDTSYHRTLRHCFGCSFEGMALGLSRVWDEKRGDEHLISIPNLVAIFETHGFLGCRELAAGRNDRAEFNSLYDDPIRKRLRVARTEVLAHSVRLGKSDDRKKSDVKGKREFDLVNGDVLNFCRRTVGLLFSLNDQLTFSRWRSGRSMDEMTNRWIQHHIAFLKHFVPQVQ